ncbi:MAG: hypothetical protein JWO06_1130, partial [Bacteroidota bacterium]|nr:hypothetical protein [Bacteroidota bacterium]
MFLVIFLGLAVLIIGISVTEKWRDHQLNGLAIAVVAILAVMGYGVWWALNTPIVYFDDNFLYKKNGKEEYSISYSRIEKFSVHST